MKNTILVIAVLCFAPALAFADNLDYSVGNYAPATVKVAGDGTLFVDYVNPKPGSSYTFSMYVWVESGQAPVTFPTPFCPIEFMKLSGTDATSWFTANPAKVAFLGYGKDTISPGQPDQPEGSFQTVQISFVVPTQGLEKNLTQVKVKARTRAIRFLGEGHGVIVRLMRAGAPTLSSWLSDGHGNHLSDPTYGNTLQVVTQHGSLNVLGTVPGVVCMNVLFVSPEPVASLKLSVQPLNDFAALPGSSLVYETQNVPANTPVQFTVCFTFSRTTLPSDTYLPRVYTFTANAESDGVVTNTSSSVTASASSSAATPAQ